jgi:Ankyrin repeat
MRTGGSSSRARSGWSNKANLVDGSSVWFGRLGADDRSRQAGGGLGTSHDIDAWRLRCASPGSVLVSAGGCAGGPLHVAALLGNLPLVRLLLELGADPSPRPSNPEGSPRQTVHPAGLGRLPPPGTGGDLP